ncbi:hypothetical protein B9G39_21870 [Zooshikella ganghwensis]|uniref:Uncharacterized protein n=1 Tax=Zooshikella ganghwensis TaxID=202772 RepID=A0A4P9VS21_9GAMM|nr:hypothetical protein B9G39_21870 [Zooshikella ganghwensis]
MENLQKIKPGSLLAWSVSDHDGVERYFKIIFHEHEEGAKQIAKYAMRYKAEELVAHREPKFDRYAALGYVPVSELLLYGWSAVCGGCGKAISLHQKKTFKNVLTEGEDIWCNIDCFIKQRFREQKSNAYNNDTNQQPVQLEL